MAELCLLGHNSAMNIARWKHNLLRFRQLDGNDKLLLARAVVWLLMARIMIAIFCFRRIAAWLSTTPVVGDDAPEPDTLRRVGYTVSAAANHVPWRSDCLPQTIAARALLQRYGYSCKIHLGVEKTTADAIAGHAWLTCGETIVIGEAQAGRYTEIHHLGE